MNQVITENSTPDPYPEKLGIISSIPNNLTPVDWARLNKEAFLLNNQVQLNKEGKICTHILYTCIPKGMLEERYRERQQNKLSYINK
ncbi:hypothetical protein cpbgf_4003000 [Cryptosporidium parvum]|uniref:Uncharacterized protein n=1 Tax=Cryptosporidium parvum TaxID=5807 RepID=F0X678_CRYPV|nr:hypothetical protein CPATCC_0019620 [Cryptosporidium parvum]WRK31887.1 hypothetical protein cpbgf_4003000 [Cryptosporidium parvum]|eukprot:QOY42139.1 hypothetical protein CPATCC_001746 [Cryptosporidium parvum]